MTQFLLDISHWQGGNPDLAQAKREGIVGVILKATQGSSFVDSDFTSNLARARAAGLLVAAYHYQEASVSAAAQVAHIKRNIPQDVPVIPDVEHGSGHTNKTRTIVKLLKEAGYQVPLSYIPGWYWQSIGSPSLAGLPPLWASRYPDNVQSYYKDEYAQVERSFMHFWDSYGGLDVKLLQFTSSGRVAGYGPLDVNAFRGTYAELEALFTGKNGSEDELSAEQYKALNNKLTELLTAVQKVPAQSATELLNRDVIDVPFESEDKQWKVKYALAGIWRQADAARDAALNDGTVDVSALADELLPHLQGALATVVGKNNPAQAKAVAAEMARRMST